MAMPVGAALALPRSNDKQTGANLATGEQIANYVQPYLYYNVTGNLDPVVL